MGILASLGVGAVEVVRHPRVEILVTGDELLPPGSELGPDQIISSNAYGVAAAAQSVGARALDLGIAPDRQDAISGDRQGLGDGKGAIDGNDLA